MIANEASTGLYFAQLHNKTCALKKARASKDNAQRLHKHQIVLEQMQKTVKELKDIDSLNGKWAHEMSRKVQLLGSSLEQKDNQPAAAVEAVAAVEATEA
jgi:DNA polymerase III epsilon subunit-like protein